jgi:hypothetical protein
MEHAMPNVRTLSRRRSLAALAVAAMITGGSVLAGVELSAASAAPVPVQQSTSSNWAGYVVDGNKFSSVAGSWVVPSAKSSSDGYAAVWVGLGGSSSSSSALEQVGTESDFAGGQARYYAWYELVPSAPVKLNLSVHPGDHISATVSVNGTSVTVSLSDLTTGKSATTTQHMSNPDTSSAEWVAEAPSVQSAYGGSETLPLADFGKVTFSNASATANGHTGSITDSHWKAQKVQLVSSSGAFSGRGRGFPGFVPGRLTSLASSASATTSSLGGQGSSFGVSWHSSSGAAGQPTAPSFAGGGYDLGGYGGGYGLGGYGYGGL